VKLDIGCRISQERVPQFAKVLAGEGCKVGWDTQGGRNDDGMVRCGDAKGKVAVGTDSGGGIERHMEEFAASGG
jgi:hypothetical protein